MEDLKLLEAEALGADRAIESANAELLAAANPEQAQHGAVVDDEAELRGLVELAAAMLGPVLPKTAEVTKHQAPQMAAAGAEIMRIHGWSMGGVLAKYAPYIALVVAVAPVAATARAEMAGRKQAANDDSSQLQPAA